MSRRNSGYFVSHPVSFIIVSVFLAVGNKFPCRQNCWLNSAAQVILVKPRFNSQSNSFIVIDA